MKKLIVFIVVLALACVVPASVFGAIIRVPDDEPTIQAGINVAEYSDTVLVADGVYKGDSNKNLDFQGKVITVQSENGPEYCIIDCENSGRGFYFHTNEGAGSVVSGFTITRSYASGGGIYCDKNSSPTVKNCVFSGNVGTYGAGLYCDYASPTIINCTFSGNTATHSGGGIYCRYSFATITNCTFSGNNASNFGGGIRSLESRPTITNCIIWGNIRGEISSAAPGTGRLPTVTYSDVQGGYTGEGNIDDDPLFVSGIDYHLTEGSPCIDQGTSEGAPDHDIDGDSRPLGEGYDMGSDEYVSASPQFAIDIKVNGSNGPLTITENDSVSVTVRLRAGEYQGVMADWWVGGATTNGGYWYNSSFDWGKSDTPISVGQWSLFNLQETTILDTQLDAGIYTFFFVLDDTPDGIFDITASDHVNVFVRKP